MPCYRLYTSYRPFYCRICLWLIKNGNVQIENGCLFMLLRTKHLYFQADNIFKQTPFTLNKLKSPWFSIFMFYSVWKHNRNDNFTLMYSDLMTRFVLISCYIINTIEYLKITRRCWHIEQCDLLLRLQLS